MKNHSWNILLIEDDEDDYVLTMHLLQEAKGVNFTLKWVSTYDDGLKEIAEEQSDVILVDYRLGSRNGIELVREAISLGCRIPLIVLTGQGSYAVDLEAMQSGAVDYLVKGQINASALERTIRYAIERQQSQEALHKAHSELERRVQERTQELAWANQTLTEEVAERIKAEAAVRESETKFRKLAEATSTAIFIVQDLCIRYANPAAQIITGYSTEELLEKKFWEISHPDYQKLLKENGIAGQWNGFNNEELDETPPARYELKLQTKTGDERWIDVSVGSIDYLGKPAWVVTAFDITERDLAEKALREVNQELSHAKSELEVRVSERTSELLASNELLAKANHQLREANQLLQTIFETEPDGLAVLMGNELYCQFANPAFQALSPTPENAPTGRRFEEIWPLDETANAYTILKKVLETGEPVFGARIYYQLPDGANRHFSLHASRLPWTEQPGVLMVIWETTRVVEAQRRAEEAAQEMRRQTEELDAVFTGMVDALLIYDCEGNPLLVNPAAIRLFGIEKTSQNHLQFAQVLNLTDQEGKPLTSQDLPSTLAMSGKTVQGKRIVFTDQEDNSRVFLVSASPLITASNLWGAVVMWHDVSERENLLGQLSAEQARLKAIIDNAPQGIVVTDHEGGIVLANPAAERLFARPIPYESGYESHIELDICYLNGAPYEARKLPLTSSTLDGEVYENLEVLMIWPDGQPRNMLINSAPIYDSQGKISGGVAIFQDITERKVESENLLLNRTQIEVQRHLMRHRENERLLIAQELHDDSLQSLIGLSFTLNEAVMMTSSYLNRKAIKSDEGESLLSKLNVIRVLLEQQIHNLRNFCGELRPPTLAPFGLEKAIRSYVETFEKKHPNLIIEIDLMPDRMLLAGDTRLALFRIFQELLNNIVRHSGASQVFVFLELDHHSATLQVEDNGRGFEVPTKWVELARKGHLGLVGARERAEAVGGDFIVSSTPGQGTAVTVSVPLGSAAKTADPV